MAASPRAVSKTCCLLGPRALPSAGLGAPPFLLFGPSREKNSQTDLWRNVEFDGRKYKEELSKFEEVEFDLNYHLSIFLPFCKLKSSSP